MKCNTKIIEGLVEQLATVVAAEMVQEGAEDLLQVEGRLCEVMQQVGQQCLRQILEGIEGRYPAPTVVCSCGEEACYRYRRQGTLLTHFGRIRYRRRYYICAKCHRGQYPLDQALQIEPGKVSARLSSELAMLGVQTALGEAAKLVKALLFIDVSPTTVQQETQRFGEYQMRQEKMWQVAATDVAHLNERQRHPTGPKRLYGSMDGVIVPVEEEWRELKVGCWYEVKPRQGKRRTQEPGELVPLPAYSPDFNADEAVWDWVRRKQPPTSASAPSTRSKKPSTPSSHSPAVPTKSLAGAVHDFNPEPTNYSPPSRCTM